MATLERAPSSPPPLSVPLDGPRPTPRRWWRPAVAATVAAVIVLVAVVAAGGVATGDRLGAPTGWAQLAARTEAAGTARVAIDIEVPDLDALHIDGAYDFDARVARFTMDLGSLADLGGGGGLPFAGEATVVVAGDVQYVRMPMLDLLPATTGKWLRVDAAAMGAPGAGDAGWSGTATDPHELLELLAAQGAQVTTVGPDTVRGVATTHSRAVLDLAALGERLAADQRIDPADLDELRAAMGDASAAVDVWADAAGRMRRVAIAATTPDGTARVTVELYDFGAPVDATVPPADEVLDLAGLLGPNSPFGR